ncbi:hypothetical protein NDN08_001522 [Rhodosorus marinus]|uniref:Protein kinase domain-containing protein n=1 Tax=Rhodosorus marinus TaxID=101924 RepID=A0AAV8UR38_9RHOD|nr:hypothetical protein NDN08_001522 [Rhodosorus marinus]
MLDEKPERIGDLVLGHVIGRGASGPVREGYILSTNEIVAIKCFERDRPFQPRNEKERVQDEIDVLKSLPAHSGLPKFVDAIDYPKSSSVYVAMEFVAGVQLKTVVENQPEKSMKASKWLRNVFKQLLAAVDELHNAKIAHRDIAPDNILITAGNRVVLVDFGNAVCLENKATGTSSAGTLAFQAPEVASKLPTMDLYAADVWAVGVTLFFCICGRLPIQESSLMQTLLKVKSGDIAIPDNIQDATRDMLTALLEPNVSARPSAKEALGHVWFDLGDDVFPEEVSITPYQETVSDLAKRYVRE